MWKKPLVFCGKYDKICTRFAFLCNVMNKGTIGGNDDEYEKETYEEVFMINQDNVDMYGVDGWQ